MAFGLYYTSQIWDQHTGAPWVVNIWYDGFNGTTKSFEMQAPGPTINYEGDGAELWEMPIKASRLSVPILVQNTSDETLINTINGDPENTFVIELTKGGIRDWIGVIPAEMLMRDNISMPYVVNVQAVDALGMLKTVPFEWATDSANGESIVSGDAILKALGYAGLDEFYNSSENYIESSLEVYESTKQDKAKCTLYSTRIKRISLVANSDKFVVDEKLTPLMCTDVIARVLTPFGGKIHMSRGVYRIWHPRNYTDNIITFYQYAKGGFRSHAIGNVMMTSRVAILNGQVPCMEAGSTFTNRSGIRRATVRAQKENGVSIAGGPHSGVTTSKKIVNVTKLDTLPMELVGVVDFTLNYWDPTLKITIKVSNGADNYWLKFDEKNGKFEWQTKYWEFDANFNQVWYTGETSFIKKYNISRSTRRGGSNKHSREVNIKLPLLPSGYTTGDIDVDILMFQYDRQYPSGGNRRPRTGGPTPRYITIAKPMTHMVSCVLKQALSVDGNGDAIWTDENEYSWKNNTTGYSAESIVECNYYDGVNMNVGAIEVADSTGAWELSEQWKYDSGGSGFELNKVMALVNLGMAREPKEVLQGTAIGNIDAFNSLSYNGKVYMFVAGTITPSENTISGEWVAVEYLDTGFVSTEKYRTNRGDGAGHIKIMTDKIARQGDQIGVLEDTIKHIRRELMNQRLTEIPGIDDVSVVDGDTYSVSIRWNEGAERFEEFWKSEGGEPLPETVNQMATMGGALIVLQDGGQLQSMNQ